MKSRTVLISLCAISLVAVSGYLWLQSTGLKQAPDITVVTTTGERIALADMRGISPLFLDGPFQLIEPENQQIQRLHCDAPW